MHAPNMIRLTARAYDDEFAFTVSRDGTDLFTTIDPVRAAERLLEPGIDNPLPLIDGARQRVERTREYANPDGRGG